MKNSFTAIKIAFPLILLSSQTQIASAADSIIVKDDGSLELSITANRRAQSVQQNIAAVTTITKEDIKRYQATRLEEVLARVPGISIKNDGGAGKVTSIFMRGSNSSHVLVLVDGVKVSSATLGSTAIEHLPLDQVDRIEIVRGPRSSLYGAEAIGGVIQIITKKGAGKLAPEFSIGLGSHNTRNVSASVSGGSDSNWFRLSASKEKTDGFNVRDSYTDYPPPSYTATEVQEKDKDGYDRNSFSLNAGHRFQNGAKAELSVLDASGSTEYDGGFQNESDFHQRAISAKFSTDIGTKLKIRASLGNALDDLDSFKNGVPVSTFTTKRNSASLLADLTIRPNQLVTIGTDWQKEKVSGSTAFAVTSRDNKAAFVSYQGDIGKHNLEASLRVDDNQQFGNHVTGGIAVGHDFKNTRVTASYGTAFKAPTFNDLYYPSSDFYHGNPDLSPEKSQTFEVGISSKQASRINWGVRAFKTDIDDLISYVSDPVTFVGTMENVDKASIKGLELELGANFANWTLKSSITLLDPKNDSGDNAGKTLIYRPKQIATLDLDRQFGRFSLGTTLHAESKRYTDAANTDTLGGYMTLDLRANYQLSKNWTIGAKLGNVLDKDYQTNKGYNQDGVNGLLTIQYSPK